MTQQKFPSGWNEARVRRVLDYYETQTDEEAAAEIEAAFKSKTHTTMEVPVRLVPIIRTLIAARKPATQSKTTHSKASGPGKRVTRRTHAAR